MITAIALGLLLLLSGLCGVLRRYQGSADTTWSWKRMPWRMSLWVPLGLTIAAVGFFLMGVPWFIALAAGALPGLWAWMPGAYNSFLVWGALGRRTTYKFAEGLQGGLGGIIASVILVIASVV